MLSFSRVFFLAWSYSFGVSPRALAMFYLVVFFMGLRVVAFVVFLVLSFQHARLDHFSLYLGMATLPCFCWLDLSWCLKDTHIIGVGLAMSVWLELFETPSQNWPFSSCPILAKFVNVECPANYALEC